MKRSFGDQGESTGTERSRCSGNPNDLAKFYFDKGKYAQAESLYKRALSAGEKVLGRDHPDVAETLMGLADVYQRQGRYKESEALCKRALALTEKASGSDHPRVAKCLNVLGLASLNQGKYAEAEAILKLALEIWEEELGSEHPDVAKALNNLGVLYQTRGKYTEAEPLYERSLAIREKTLNSHHPKVAGGIYNLAFLYKAQGKYREAESLFKRALVIWEKALGRDHSYVAECLDSLACLYQKQGRYGDAKPLFERAIAIYGKALGPEHPYVAESLTSLGLVCIAEGKHGEAGPLLQRALVIRDKTLEGFHPDVAESLNALGTLYFSQGKYPEAGHLFRRALTIREKALGPEHPDVATSLTRLAILYSCSGRVEECLAHYDKLGQSRQRFLDYVFSYASEEQKMRYVEKHPLITDSLLSFAIINGSNESRGCALDMILKGKGAVVDALSAEKRATYRAYDCEVQRTARRHAEVCGEISALTLSRPERLCPELYRDRLLSLHGTKDRLETELARGCAEFRDRLAARRFTVGDVANALPEGGVLWEFIVYQPYDLKKVGTDEERTGAHRYLAFILDHGGNTALADLGDSQEIDTLVGLVRQRVYAAREEVYSPLAVDAERQLRNVTGKLYDIIVAPFESHLADKTDVFVAPDGQLNLLPFEILSSPDGKNLIERLSISYLSSGRDLLRFKKRLESSDWALMMADPDFDLSEKELSASRSKVLRETPAPAHRREQAHGASEYLGVSFSRLPRSQEETGLIAKITRKYTGLKLNVHYGADALEEVLKGLPSAPKFLHLATHGYFCGDVGFSENPTLENPLLRSGLALAGANRVMDGNPEEQSQTEDGVLTAFEVSGLNLLGTELVTLSACETGVGQVKNWEGVYGLRRAFQHAGARTILMSLWKVPDKETCDLMACFYDNWLSGEHSKKEALRSATLKVMKDCRDKYGVAHPYFWGGFVLLGDPN